MSNSAKKIFSPIQGIAIAVVSMWILGALGVFLLIHFGNWSIIGNESTRDAISTQGMGFYLAYFGCRIPSVVFAGYIIAFTRLRRPYVCTVIVVLLFQSTMLTLRFVRGSWIGINETTIAISVVGEIAGVVILLACALLAERYGRCNVQVQ
jgi:hypothetical protein